jgi:GT2 family glycosyltransferase
MTEVPLVSVVILNFNRKEVLRRCIQDALALDWPHLEWIVVDNASTDGSADMAESEFGGSVRTIRRQVNSVTAARNEGFRAARGEFILSLDNDILLPDKQVIHQGLALFDEFPEVGLLAFRIGDPQNAGCYLHEHWWHPVPFEQGKDRFFFTSYFPEAAALIRSEAIRRTGGYDEEFFMGVEQGDLALKLLGEGLLLLYCPTLSCVELEVRGQLSVRKSRIHYLNMRNKLWTAWKHYPLGRGLKYAGGRIAASALRSVRNGWTGYFLSGLKDGLLAPPAIRRQRQPLPPSVWAVYDRIQAGWFVEPSSNR